jgi:L-asparaginase/Glu-tRNA(Gln) amidotransferase subunit D
MCPAGSQLPLASPRSDARQNLIDALTCATAAYTPPHMALSEVAVCFGGKLIRGNRTQKVNSSNYQVGGRVVAVEQITCSVG